MPPRNSPQTPGIRNRGGPFVESTHARAQPLDGRLPGPDIVLTLPPSTNQGYLAEAESARYLDGTGRRRPHGGRA